MKKTLFSAIGVLAIVTASLAFTNKSNPNIFTNDENDHCTVLTQFRTSTSPTVLLTGPFSTTSNASASCPQVVDLKAVINQ